MGKNTLRFLQSSQMDLSVPTLTREKDKKQDEPSGVVIKNILDYSKALKVEKCKDGKSFIEYITN